MKTSLLIPFLESRPQVTWRRLAFLFLYHLNCNSDWLEPFRRIGFCFLTHCVEISFLSHPSHFLDGSLSFHLKKKKKEQRNYNARGTVTQKYTNQYWLRSTNASVATFFPSSFRFQWYNAWVLFFISKVEWP